MLFSRQCLRALVNENERDAKFTQSDFKASSSLFYLLQQFIDLLRIYYQCLTSFYKTTWQGNFSAMKEL